MSSAELHHDPLTPCKSGVCCRVKRQAITRESARRRMAEAREAGKPKPVETPSGVNPETMIQDRIRLELGKDPEVALWRNNVGEADTYNPYTGAVGRLKYGLCVGSSDLIGVIKPMGRFIALEVKQPGKKATPEQERFLRLVRNFGGFGAVVDSVEEARAAVSRCKKGYDQ